MYLRVTNTICALALAFVFLMQTSRTSALSPPNVALGPMISTTGLGVEAATPIVPRFLNLNIGLTAFGFKDVMGSDCVSIDYATRFCMPFNGKVRLGAIPLFLTFYPFGGWFNLQAGVYFNNNRLSVSAQAPAPYTAFGSGLIANSEATDTALRQYAKAAGLSVPPLIVAPLGTQALPPAQPAGPHPHPYFVMLGTIEPRTPKRLVPNT